MANDAKGSGRRNNVRFSVNQRSKTAKLVAVRKIKKGEELLVSYGRNYWPQQLKSNEVQRNEPIKKKAEIIVIDAIKQVYKLYQEAMEQAQQQFNLAINQIQHSNIAT